MFMDRKDSIISRNRFLPTCSIDSMQSKSKSQQLFYGYQQTDSKVYMSGKRFRMANVILKENKVRGLTLLDPTTYYSYSN